MKRMLIKEKVHGRMTTVEANTTYRSESGGWVAEVEGDEINRACDVLCHGIEGCTCDNLRVEADTDDDGKEYRLVTR